MIPGAFSNSSDQGVVVAGHPLAAQAGFEALRAGGNAIDASVAVAATLSVVRPHSCGVGGDFFALVRMASDGRVQALQGSGAAPIAADPGQIAGPVMPGSGPLSVTVPGAVDGWLALHERYGTMPIATLFAPAVEAARSGFPIYPTLARNIARRAHLLRQDPGLAALFLQDDGQPLALGALVVQAALARTLEAIGQDGRGAFYDGPIGRLVADRVQSLRGWLSTEDLAGHGSVWAEPVSTSYRGLNVYEQPPPSQGFLLLQMLNILAGDDLSELGCLSPEIIHLMVEAKKRAFADREQYLGDPAWVDVPVRSLLSASRASSHRAAIDPRQAANHVVPSPTGRDTTYFAVVDRAHNAVSAIQSLFQGFGSCIYEPDTGVILNNRGAAFVLTPGHPNVLAPKKRPAHTLSCYMVTGRSGLAIVGGTPGGHGQVQTNLQVLTALIDHQLSPQEAVDAPRWVSGDTMSTEVTTDLHVEARIPARTRSVLESWGHRLSVLGPWEDRLGSAKVVRISPRDGGLVVGADQRREACAVGYREV